jgi:F-type H+-transporting ATPase subunit a
MEPKLNVLCSEKSRTMRLIQTILMAAFLLVLPWAGRAVEAANAAAPAKEEGLSLDPVAIGHVGPLPITNSMVVTWIVAAGLILFARIATRNIKQVPSGAQNLWELLVESLYDFLSDLMGHDLAKKTFSFFATVFILILFTNWFGLLPGFGTIGWGHDGPQHFEVTRAWLRGGNANLNMTLAMALIFFVLWIIWAFQSNGPIGLVKHIFAPKGGFTGLLLLLMVPIFLVVGVLEVVSIVFRPVSLSFRLYGNIFAGENILDSMSNLVPGLGWLLPIPFYFMELMVGFIQAFVFMLLTAVYTLLICQHDEEDHAKEHGH